MRQWASQIWSLVSWLFHPMGRWVTKRNLLQLGRHSCGERETHGTLNGYIPGDFTLSWVLGDPVEKVTIWLRPVLFGSHGKPGM